MLPKERLVEFEAEFAIAVGSDKKIAAIVDDINAPALICRGTDQIEYRPQIEIDDENAERAVIARVNWGRNPQRRYMRHLDDAMSSMEVDRRNIDGARGKTDRLFEVIAVGFALQFAVRHIPDRAMRTRTIDPDDLPPPIGNTDHAKLRIDRLGGELRGEPRRQPRAPLIERRAVSWIDGARDGGADDAFDSSRMKSCDIGTGGAGRCLDFLRQQLRAHLGTLQPPRQDGRLNTVIGVKTERRRGDEHHADDRQS
jgi:hypothetical protein